MKRRYGWITENMGEQAQISPEDKTLVETDLQRLLKVETWAQARRMILERTEKPLLPVDTNKIYQIAKLIS